MKWALFFIVGFGVLAGVIGWWFWSVDATRDDLRAFCSATHRGQTWAQTKDRAGSKGFDIAGYGGNDQLVSAEAMDHEFGCVVVVDKDGYVLESRFAELLKK